MIRNLEEQNSVFNQFISEIRDKDIQRDRQRFRRNLERIGEVFAYEISKTMTYKKVTVQTPLGEKTMSLPDHQPVLSTILRAGLPLHQGLLNYFDNADNAFISAYRKYNKEGDFEIYMEYASSPELDNRTLIISDPMLATASSMLLTYKELLKAGKPEHVHIVTIISSQKGIETLVKGIAEKNVTLWVGAIDPTLNEKAYIIPGLGDAGDLAYGVKR
ncbi:MAG TPA: uracil phosphoribosyltransferase [Bacteroidales bacterium]|nr:uracil phosphoribosyltransferase [Bacteroidales bacterium]